MKGIISTLLISSIFCMFSFAQNSIANLKFTYPACSLLKESLIDETDDVRVFVIQNQEEFDQYFKISDNSKINFEKNIVIAGFVGKENMANNINLNGATYNTRKSVLYIKYDTNKKPVGTCGKYCVLVVPKVEYKKNLFLNGKKYNKALRRKDFIFG